MKLTLTDLLDLAGSLLVVAALALLVLPLGLAAALGVAGVGLLTVSYLIDQPPLPELVTQAVRAVQRWRRRRKGASS